MWLELYGGSRIAGDEVREGKESEDARQAGFLRTSAIPLSKKQSCGMASIGCHDLPVI